MNERNDDPQHRGTLPAWPRRTVCAAIAAAMLTGLGAIPVAVLSGDAASRRADIRRRNRRRRGGRSSETSISQPGSPGQPGTPGTVTGTTDQTET